MVREVELDRMEDKMVDVVIKAVGISRKYGNKDAVKNLDLTVKAGEILGILGPNGAGKTTTIKILTTLIKSDSGSVHIGGYDIKSHPNRARKIIGLAGQSEAVDEKLTARENLDIFGSLYGLPKRELQERIQQLIKQFRMKEFADRPVETYSGGQKRRLDIVAALIAEPKALFLDEPTTGLDIRSRNEIWQAVRDLATQGTAVVLTTQYLEEAEQLASSILVIDKGNQVVAGTPNELKRKFGEEILEVHLINKSAANKAESLIKKSFLEKSNEGYILIVKLTDGSKESLSILRKLDDESIDFADFELRKPTLADVFLSITKE